jgi:uncharacterized RDD family membrane protein YckC
MRCPKCQYITFDSADRCRNCGYELSLSAAEAPPVDVTIGRDDPSPVRRDAEGSALDVPLSGDPGRAAHRSSGGGRPLTMNDLPLFIEGVADDQAPLVTPSAVPRPPLAVRRSTPGIRGRGRQSGAEELSLNLAAGQDADSDTETGARSGRGATDAAGIGQRLAAGLIDVAVVGSIDALVVYLTLRLCQLTIDDWAVLPLVPLGAFLLLLGGGYFVLFTAAGGQTIGKMVARIRVVAGSPSAPGQLRVSFSSAVVRAVAGLGSLAALGAGFLPVLFRADRRAFHDRVADTRVVSA